MRDKEGLTWAQKFHLAVARAQQYIKNFRELLQEEHSILDEQEMIERCHQIGMI